jgi:HSP20 family protein
MNSSYTVNRLFNLADALLAERPAPAAATWLPPVDVLETPTAYELLADLPGVTGSEVKVVVREGVLTLSGERPALPDAEGTTLQLSERRFGAFQRRFALPKDADGEQVSATFNNGVLTISVPKREAAKPREIEVKVA